MLTERRRGVTLIEIMVSALILAAMAGALTQVALVTMRTVDEARRQSDLLSACKRVLDQVLSIPFDRLPEQDGLTFTVSVGGGEIMTGGRVRVSRDLDGNGLTNPAPPHYEGRPDILRVSVEFRGRVIVERLTARGGPQP